MDFVATKLRSLVHTVSSRHHHHHSGSRGQVEQRFRRNTVSTLVLMPSYAKDINACNRIGANKLVDKLLDYMRDNYLKPIDPYHWDEEFVFKPRSYGLHRYIYIYIYIHISLLYYI